MKKFNTGSPISIEKRCDPDEEAREGAKREADIEAIRESLGDGAAEAMREYMSLFTDGLYKWFANLYDPETGALYYSNSGRDNEGFLPDIESTCRGYSWLITAGLTEKYDSLYDAFPEFLREKQVKWTQGLQSSENGYFYHPQWPKETHNVSRLGRDLKYSLEHLRRFRGEPLYDAPSGERGILGAPSLALKREDGSTASVLPDYLQNLDEFEKYLESLNWVDRTYPSGHALESQSTQIIKAGPEYVKKLEDFLNKKQSDVRDTLRAEAKAKLLSEKPSASADELERAMTENENGLWEPIVKYESVNGLMKICSTYNHLGLKINYADRAFLSAVKIATFDGVDADGAIANQIVNVFNPWVMLNILQANVRKFGTPEEAQRLESLLRENAEALIRATVKKLRAFKKEDESFGYCAVGVPALNQKMPSAVPGTNEGDVNGCTIATVGILSHACEALHVPRPQMFFDRDLEVYLGIIKERERLYNESRS